MSHQTSSLPRFVLTEQCISKAFNSHCVCDCFSRRNLFSISSPGSASPRGISCCSSVPSVSQVTGVVVPDRGAEGLCGGKWEEQHFQEIHTALILEASIHLLHRSIILCSVDVSILLLSMVAEKGQTMGISARFLLGHGLGTSSKAQLELQAMSTLMGIFANTLSSATSNMPQGHG